MGRSALNFLASIRALELHWSRFTSNGRQLAIRMAILVLANGITGAISATDATSDQLLVDVAFRDTERTPGLGTAAEALASLEAPAGFRATLFASEPLVRQPIGVTTDYRGRIWVAENYTYCEAPGGFDPNLRDRITILEDTDHDGEADQRTIFWDQAERLTSVEVGVGGVWALCPPNLLFIPDADRDDQPDGEPRIVLNGWNSHGIRHNVVNGLRWGPDGWLYGRHGILRDSLPGVPGTPEDQRSPLNCGIWRYHPLRNKFEIVARGTTNSWGMDWNEHGQLFFINTVIGHLWHAIPGAHYERMYGEDFNPHLYGLIPQTADHYHWDRNERWLDIRELGVTKSTDAAGGGHAHSGLMIYQGGNWPAKYRGNAFAINFHGRRLNQDILHRHGAGYRATHGQDLVQIGDPWFRGLDLRIGADGSVFITDWTDAGECHDEDGVHRNSGRIFKLSYGDPGKPIHGDLAQLSNNQLVGLLTHENVWFARRARAVLRDRFADGQDLQETRKQLRELFDASEDARHKLQALWTLHLMDGADINWLCRLLNDESEHVRVWAVRFLIDSHRQQPREWGSASATLAKIARKDSSGLVLLFLASGLQQMTAAEMWPVATELAQRREWADDPALQLMIWYAIESAVPHDPGEAIRLLQTTQIPLLRRHIARRLAAELSTIPLAMELLLEQLAESKNPLLHRDALAGIAAALKGRRNLATPQNWELVWERLSRADDPLIRQTVRELAISFGDQRATGELRKLVTDAGVDAESRRSALAALVAGRPNDLASFLQSILDDPQLNADAVRGLATIDDERTAQLLLARYPTMTEPLRAQAISTLASRATFAVQLLAAIENEQLSADAVSAFEIRQMWSFDEPAIQQRIKQLWPQVRPTAGDKADEIRRYTELLSEERLRTANASQGRIVFEKQCASCHQLFGAGGRIGPDLTGGQRNNLYFLLNNIVDPSGQVAANYRMSIIRLDTGRVVTGVILRSTEHILEVQTASSVLTIDRVEVEDIQPSALSIMPEKILNHLTDEQICNLFAYLQSSQNVPLPAAGE